MQNGKKARQWNSLSPPIQEGGATLVLGAAWKISFVDKKGETREAGGWAETIS
jgi:hypothetical protein